MFKFVLFVLCALHAVNSKISLSRFNDPKILAAFSTCSTLHKLEIGDLLETLDKGDGDENMKKYNMCLYKAVNAIDSNNKVNKEVITQYLKIFYPDHFQQILDKCVKDVISNIEEAYQISACTSTLVKN
ncbi:unnamed protein product [Diabrotica balteata]|uniref:Uncharacterized protein n=1 Tax=Diabrotica balteata TaxID=107213 RepID=A0A9N9XAN9_DIABA|nr:unnamed protein product [Diabrotica balteata]